MARKGNRAPGSEAEKKKEEPTSEAAASEEVIEEILEDEAAGGAAEEVAEKPEVEGDAPPVAPEGGAAPGLDPKHRPKGKKKMFRIILGEQDNSDKNQDQLVTDPSDGKQFLIKRGFEVEVPEGVVNNLKESIVDKLEYDENGNEVWRPIPRFALTELGEVK
ncbi:hypothetical protein KAR91_32730 [Candidatus Pacearchaeota archaeon]|nr:hypothetical protein [Candidatus Pacearchaeota archaeon]